MHKWMFTQCIHVFFSCVRGYCFMLLRTDEEALKMAAEAAAKMMPVDARRRVAQQRGRNNSNQKSGTAVSRVRTTVLYRLE